jgi:hypothetical protein
MVGAFLAGVVLERDWFELPRLDALRANVLLVLMPVFFLSTGLRTQWDLGGLAVFAVTAGLVLVSVSGKLLGLALAAQGQHEEAASALEQGLRALTPPTPARSAPPFRRSDPVDSRVSAPVLRSETFTPRTTAACARSRPPKARTSA